MVKATLSILAGLALLCATAHAGSSSAESGEITVDTRDLLFTDAYQLSDGSGQVRVRYRVVSSSAVEALTVTVSASGGAAWDIVPAADALSGDINGTFPTGTHQFTWDASQTLASGTFGTNFRVRLEGTVDGVDTTAVSSPFTISLSGGLVVRGRVLDGASRAALEGVAIALGGDSASTGSDGRFVLTNVDVSTGSTLTASRTGYLTHTEGVFVPPGAVEVTVPDILLELEQPGVPVITALRSNVNGLFLEHASVEVKYTASVNWNGLTPDAVRFYANDTLIEEVSGSGTGFPCEFDVGERFKAASGPDGNVVRAIAVADDGTESEAASCAVDIIPLPEALSVLTRLFPLVTYGNQQIGVDFDFPRPPLDATISLPVIGTFGVEFGCSGSFDYTFGDGAWEAALGIGAESATGKRGRRPGTLGLTRYPKMKLYIGNKEISGKLQGGMTGTATLADGIEFDSVFGHGEIAARLELGRFGVLDLLGPGFSTAAGKIPGLEAALKVVSIIVYVIPGVEGDLVFALGPEFAFDSFELTGKVGLEAAYEPDLGFCKARIYVGGEPSVTFQYPGDLFKRLRFKAYAGLVVEVWMVGFDFEYVFVDVSIGDARGGGTTRQRLVLAGARNGEVNALDRSYLDVGRERFVGTPERADGQSEAAADALDDFRDLGLGPMPGSVLYTGDAEARDSAKRDSAAQVDVSLVENVFPNASPALAGHGQELMLLYAADTGAREEAQFTDIKWLRYDGTSWSTPAVLSGDARAEFAPQVCYDGNDDAIAVWERVKDETFDELDVEATAAQMEIVWSRWDHGTGAWSQPAALSDNAYLDHAPLLCGPLDDGSVMLVWTQNEANLLTGSGTEGAAENSRAVWSRWDSAAGNWSVSTALVEHLPDRTSQALAGSGQAAVYAWTRDLDGDEDTDDDQELYYALWDSTGGTWGAATRHTNDDVRDCTVRAAMTSDGTVLLAWRQGPNLVVDSGLSGTPTVAREDSDSAGFADYVLTAGAAGNMVLIWQDMSEDGSDAHLAVYDPSSETWSQDLRLFTDSPLERSFAPVWDDSGNLTIAYNKVELQMVTKTVLLEDGTTMDVANVPQPVEVDLHVVRRQLVRDLALDAGDLNIDGNDYLPGDAVELSASVSNAGSVAVEGVTVGFYHGDPDAGGGLIGESVADGWLPAGATTTLAVEWVVPEPAATHTIWAVVDPVDAVLEHDETNNAQSVGIGGTDLAVLLRSYSVETDGSLQVIAEVLNEGAPGAPATVLAIRRENERGDPLATVAVPALEPGRLAQVSLDLPAGTQAAGSTVYVINVDEEGAVADDVDSADDTVTFSAYRFVDADEDGMPRDWEALYGLSDQNPDDADVDSDGDGLTNLEEYAAGTDPTKRDTDGDGLEDAAEVNTHNTDPTRQDSDGDGITDPQEIDEGSDPMDSESLPTQYTVTVASTGSGHTDPLYSTDVYSGSTVVIQAVADDGHAVGVWTVDALEGQDGGDTLDVGPVRADTDVTVEFLRAFDLVLHSGWNLFSLPIEPRDPDVSAWLGTARDVTCLWRWDAAMQRFVPETVAEALTGYWVCIPDDWGERVAITVLGSVPDTGRLSLSRGWNLVGVEEFTEAQDLADILDPVFGWNGEDYEEREGLNTGRAYWLYKPE